MTAVPPSLSCLFWNAGRKDLAEQTELLLAAAHLPSKVNWDRADQTAEVAELADQIRREEDRRGHRRTVLVGDLNMNPFEDGVVQATGLHATMAADIAAAGTRRIQGRDYPFFYNPMWGFLGDRTPGPPGTFFYRHGGHISYDWNMFDQVLLRPAVLELFDIDVGIATMIGERDLRNRLGRPDAGSGSDHFPIHFRLHPIR